MSSAPSIDVFLPLRSAGTGDTEVAPAVRRYLACVRVYLEHIHRRGISAQVVNESHSDLIDRLLRRLYARAEEHYFAHEERAPESLAVLAVGGYARREMAIASDVDLLFLYSGALESPVAALTEGLQQWLWDSGLSLGCATRNTEDTLELSKSDATVATAILDARFLIGNVELFHEFVDSVSSELLSDPARFIAQSLAAMQQRHRKCGESLYLLQPNLKDGVGALRDYQSAYWIARAVHPAASNSEDLLHFGLLTENEMDELRAALLFLWRARNELHLQSRRKCDQMSFEHQVRMAEALGYADAGGEDLPVERFMRDYYRHARAIVNYSESIIEQCHTRALRTGAKPAPLIVEGGFRIAQDHLEIPHRNFLRAEPRRLVEAFEIAARHDVPLSRTARRLVRENLDLIDAAFRRDPAISASFQRILEAEHRVMRTLMHMNEVGLLARYLPEWDHIACRWQHVIYHTYTVDVHSIFLVEQLRRLQKGEYETESPDLTALIRAAPERAVLYLACLLHDIGKGLGGNHSQRGAELARTCCERLGFEPERSEHVVFLVEQHLLMSHVAQRRDLSEPKLIVDFARTVGSRTRLHSLYLLTFADIRASSPTAWNEWKGQLLRELFERTSEFLETGGGDAVAALAIIDERVSLRQRSAREELHSQGISEETIEAFFNDLPRRYFITHTPRQIARHARVVLAFARREPLSMAVREMRGGFSELIVCTPDVRALYSNVAGTLTARGINILGSHVYTTRSGLALEVYRLTTPEGGPEEIAEAWSRFEKALRSVISGEVRVADLLRQRRLPHGHPGVLSPTPPSVEISSDESDFYTIVDVSADDRPGLLYDLTRTLAEHGFEIYISKATTILDQVADTFYIKDTEGRKPTDPEQLAALRRTLLAAAVPPLPSEAGRG